LRRERDNIATDVAVAAVESSSAAVAVTTAATDDASSLSAKLASVEGELAAVLSREVSAQARAVHAERELASLATRRRAADVSVTTAHARCTLFVVILCFVILYVVASCAVHAERELASLATRRRAAEVSVIMCLVLRRVFLFLRSRVLLCSCIRVPMFLRMFLSECALLIL
jgi:hypothetical protein